MVTEQPDETPEQYAPFSVEIQIGYVDPVLLNLLTGGNPDPDGTGLPVIAQDVYGVELYVPIKRTFWRWLRRKPRQYKRIYIPRAIVEGP